MWPSLANDLLVFRKLRIKNLPVRLEKLIINTLRTYFWICVHVIMLLCTFYSLGRVVWTFETLVSESCSVMSDSLWPRGLYSPWNFPGHNVGVGSLSLLHRIFPTQGLNPGLPHCRQILYQLSHKGSPKIQEWVTYPFSSRSSCPRKRTRVETLVLWF